MDPITLRAMERTLVVLIGGLCAYLGYRLFLHIPHQRDSEGKINLPGGISIFVTRVGPGVFFALFGAGIVAFSLYQGVIYFRERPADAGAAQREGESSRTEIELFGGVSQRASSGETRRLDDERLNLRSEIEFLNTLPSWVRTNLNDEQRRSLRRRIVSTKLALMKTVWGPDWGDQERFRLWAESGGTDPIPEGLTAPAAYYRFGQEEAK
jgi:hypothetical protein